MTKSSNKNGQNIDTISFYQGIIDNLFDGVYFVDTDRNITYWNKGAERITGYKAEKVIGRPCRNNILNHVSADGVPLCKTQCPLLATMNDGKTREADVFLHHADGHRVPVFVKAAPMYNQDGNIIGAVETFSADSGISSIRSELRELRHVAHRDKLTGIANRNFLDMRLHGFIAEQKMEMEQKNAVLFIDIDNFKQVNDTYGHEMGDKVLQIVANTIHENLRRSDVVGRWGGEEFLVILYNITSETAVRNIAEKLRILIEFSSIELENTNLSVTVSIGATILTNNDTTDSVVNRADQLMYNSKTSGKNRVSIG